MMGEARDAAPADLFDVAARLSEEERLVRRAVARFVDERFLPVVQRHFRAGTFPMDLVPEMAALGLFGMNLTGWGCAGLGNVGYGAAMQELERGETGATSSSRERRPGSRMELWPTWR